MREIKINIETAQRWANGTDKELKGLALQTYPELAKKELPKTWEELQCIYNGWFISGEDKTYKVPTNPTNGGYKQLFATKEQAEASIALAQLSQLREVYRNGWVPDWSDYNVKYIISFKEDEIVTDFFKRSNYFLSFQDEKTRDLFFENFRELIEKAKPLFS